MSTWIVVLISGLAVVLASFAGSRSQFNAILN